MRVPWTAGRYSHSILKEINPDYSLEGLMLKLKLQYFGHLVQRIDSLEKTLIPGKIEGGRRRDWTELNCYFLLFPLWFLHRLISFLIACCFSSVQSLSNVQLCDAMNHRTPGLAVHNQLLEFMQTHAHRVGDAIQPSHPVSSPSPPAPNPSQHQSLYLWDTKEVPTRGFVYIRQASQG